MSEDKFERGNRYIVIKRSDLTENEQSILFNFITEHLVRTRDCVVVESDWPEYLPTWKAIEDRVTGRPTELDNAQATISHLRDNLDGTRVHAADLRLKIDAQRLRADTAEAERDVARHSSSESIKAEVRAKEKLAAAEQRIAALVEVLTYVLDVYSNHLTLGTQSAIRAALNPKPEAGSHEVAREALKMENQRIVPARFKCLACGEYHEGSGNLPCPKTIPYAGV